MLCVSYFLQNSKMTWNHLHFTEPEQVKIFTNLLENSQQSSTCIILNIQIYDLNISGEFLSSSFLCNIAEFYCTKFRSIFLLIELLKLSKLKVLHFNLYSIQTDTDSENDLEQCSKVKQSLQNNCVVQEIMLEMDIHDNHA